MFCLLLSSDYLYRCGRQTEAYRYFMSGNTVLVREFDYTYQCDGLILIHLHSWLLQQWKQTCATRLHLHLYLHSSIISMSVFFFNFPFVFPCLAIKSLKSWEAATVSTTKRVEKREHIQVLLAWHFVKYYSIWQLQLLSQRPDQIKKDFKA